ncbi:hypothetical protein [Gordonia paraffinivorans]|uniref:hypothetical protein n=1 Tax=Gordonia paraffinivorans TaxID=175628 RepID=UPI001444A7F3|nr:hypothetical protein [Gordonia paraffinivorans]
MRTPVLRIAAGLSLTLAAVAGCSTGGEPSAESARADSSWAARSSEAMAAPGPTTEADATPAGTPVGTATMEVQGSGTAVIRYRINGGPEEVESNAALPWKKEYPVYPKIESTVSAEGPGADGCTITLSGLMVSFKAEANPTCGYSHYE